MSDEYDLVIVGAGLSGSVIAQQASARAGLRSLIIDKRDHIGGNCFDYVDEHGIRVTFCIICFKQILTGYYRYEGKESDDWKRNVELVVLNGFFRVRTQHGRILPA